MSQKDYQKKLIQYINNQKKSGYTNDVIVRQLKRYNYSDDIIQTAYHKIKILKILRVIFVIIVPFVLLIIGFNLTNLNNPQNQVSSKVIVSANSSYPVSKELISLAKTGINSVELVEYSNELWIPEVQYSLRNLGYEDLKGNKVSIDTYFGPQTTYALEKFVKNEKQKNDANITLSTWIIDKNMVELFGFRLSEKNLSFPIDNLKEAAKLNIKFGYQFTENKEIIELQTLLNIISTDSKILVNGNYDFVTASRLIQIKKAYNSITKENEQLIEDESFDYKTLLAISKMLNVENVSKITGISWDRTIKVKIQNTIYKLTENSNSKLQALKNIA